MNFEVEKGNIDSVFSVQKLDRKILEEAAEDLKNPDERRNRMEQDIARMIKVQKRNRKMWQPEKLRITRMMKEKLAFVE